MTWSQSPLKEKKLEEPKKDGEDVEPVDGEEK
jgi:hypothetical protein